MLSNLPTFKSLHLLEKIFFYGLGALVMASLVVGPYRYGKRVGREQATVKFQTAMATATALEQQKARLEEWLWQKRVARANDQQYLMEKENEKLKQDLLDAVKSGNVKLRAKFTCKTSDSLRATPGNPQQPTNLPDRILSTEDQEFLIRIGAEADEVRGKLIWCNRLLASWPRQAQKN